MINYDRQYFENRFEELKNDRVQFHTLWNEINEYVYPVRADGVVSNDTPIKDKSKDKFIKMINGTPIKAVNTLAVGMQSGLTSPARKWFKLELEEKKLNDDEENKRYLFDVENIMYSVFAKSNFYSNALKCYKQTSSFGTFCCEILEDEESVIRFRRYLLGQYYLGIDKSYRVNTIYREFMLTANQLIEEFGEENCSATVVNAYEKNLGECSFKIIHAVETNKNYKGRPFEKKFISVYYESDNKEKNFLRFNKNGAFEDFPVITPRWETDEEAYGSDCLGFIAKGDCKMLQTQEKDILRGIQLGLNPPLQTAGDFKEVRLTPGAITQVSGTDQSLSSIYNVNFRVGDAEAKKITTENAIKETYFNNLFLLIAGEDKSMTATEVNERREEKFLMLGNVIERLENEFLNPIITKTFNILNRRGLLPAPPESLQGQEIKIKYISLLAQAQKSGGLSSLANFLRFSSEVMQVKPEIADKINFDETIEEYADMIGVSPRVLNTEEKVEEIRDYRNKLIQAQSQAETLRANVQSAKTLSDTKVNEPNALTGLMGVVNA